MPRRRFGVVLLVPQPAAGEIDGLRRACGDTWLRRVRPHITLVPPVNVRDDAVGEALGILRDAAVHTRPVELTLGPPASFAPVSPTLYLSVRGDRHALDRLHALRDKVFTGPLARPLDHPFVPHVTLADEASPERLAAGLVALADYGLSVTFDRVHLLEEQTTDGRHWRAVADYPFAPRHVVGRGGLDLELTVSEVADPEAIAFEAAVTGDRDRPARAPDQTPNGARSLVVVGRRGHAVVGVARGWCDRAGTELQTMLVDPAVRGQGIGRHLEAAFRHAASR